MLLQNKKFHLLRTFLFLLVTSLTVEALASFVTMNKKAQRPVTLSKEDVEEADYINSAENFKKEVKATSGRTVSSFIQTFVSLAACWLILLLIIILHIYYISVISDKNTKQMAEIKNLKSQNEELKTNEKILMERVQMLDKNLCEFNVVLPQRVVDNYCPKENNDRKCNPCQKGWNQRESRCYAYANVKGADQRTWAGAQDDCKEKFSNLTVISDENEKNHVFTISGWEFGISGFWIGLRAVNRTWKWIDGTDLIDQMWVDQPAADGQCVTSLRGSGWRSVSCETKNAWICENKALYIS